MSKLWIFILYAIALCGLAPLRPLWLDELIQLSDTYQLSFAETMSRVAHNPGGVPFAYLAENLFVNLGHPFYTAHVFPILCALGGLACLFWLVELLEVSARWLAVPLFAVLPISLRYAVEARQYGPALAFSISATALLVWVDRKPSWPKATLYALIVSLGMYCQPYVVFVAAAHMLWALRRQSMRYVLFGGLLGVSLFMPWYIYARGFWVEAVAEAGYQSSFAWKTPLMVLRELSGGGYLLTGTLLCLAFLGYLRTEMPTSSKRLILLCILTPLPLVLGANTLFNYFFAIRQLLFVVPPVCILAAEGVWALQKGWRPAVALAFLLIAGVYDVRWFSRANEDWSLAAAEAAKLTSNGGCVLALPESVASLYALYQPSLKFCERDQPAVVLLSGYAAPELRKSVIPSSPGIEMGGTTLFSAAKLKP